MTPLPLDSPRWRQLKAHFGNAGQDGDLSSVPSLLVRWHKAVGTYREEYEYDDVRESYLHQQTILDVAYAVVPHVVSRLRELDPDRRLEVLEDLAVVESVRLLSREEVEARVSEVGAAFEGELHGLMVQNTRDRLASLPSDLAPAYLAAIEEAVAVGGLRWREIEDDDSDGPPKPRYWRRHVGYLRDSGWSDADIAFAIQALRVTEPHEVVEPIYKLSHDGARHALCTLDKVPPGWFERTRLRLPDGELGFRAVHTLAWWAAIDIDTILGKTSA